MKAFFRLSIYAILLVSFGCEEKNTLINYRTSDFNILKLDTSYIAQGSEEPQPKNVLLEDFTAVKCVNCPRAQKQAKNIQNANPGRVVVNAVHVSWPGNAYNESKEDYRTVEGENIFAYLGGPTGLPIGSVDRKIYGSSELPLVMDFQWPSIVNQQLAIPTPVNITFLNKTYFEPDRTMELQIKLVYTNAVNSPQYLSAFINESDITDLQLTTSGVDSNYVHAHVLRASMFPHSGLKLAENCQKGQTFIVNITAKIPDKWNADNCHFGAFVHQRDGSAEVFHVQETSVK